LRRSRRRVAESWVQAQHAGAAGADIAEAVEQAEGVRDCGRP